MYYCSFFSFVLSYFAIPSPGLSRALESGVEVRRGADLCQFRAFGFAGQSETKRAVTDINNKKKIPRLYFVAPT